MLNQVLNSGPVLLLTQHWVCEMPKEEKQGETWQEVTRENEVFHKHLPTEKLYRPDSNAWTASKTLGLLWVGGYFYFGAAMLRHFGEGVVEAAKASHTVFKNWQLAKSSSDFNYRNFFANNASEFGTAKAQFIQGMKDLALFAPFLCFSKFTPYNFSNYKIFNLFFYAISIYTVYNPRQPRVNLEEVQNWWQPQPNLGGTMPQILEPIDQCTTGTYSLTEIFKINAIRKDLHMKKE